jgi:hypothetical protein
MENIYSHKVSPDELRTLSKMIPGRRIDEKNSYENSLEDDLIFADLYRLYSLRKDKRKAMDFFNRIKDSTLKYFLNDF